jgi:hypothetical protein
MSRVKNTRPRDTSANRARKDKDPRFQRFGKQNGAFKDGTSPHAYRLKAKAKPKEVVHHVNENKKDVRKSNLKVLKNTKGLSAAAKHNKAHPEKGRKAAKARMRNSRKGRKV